MTAATSTLDPARPSFRAGLALPPGWWRRLGAALLVCLPVPVCAASGLSLPLPATVERLAALLVPWAEAVPMSANEALPVGARGTIVARAGEAVPARATVLERGDTGALAVRAGPDRAALRDGRAAVSAPAGTEPGRAESSTGASGPAARATAPSTGSAPVAGGAPSDGGVGSPGPSTGGEQPAPAPAGSPGPVEAVESAVAPAKPVVEQVVQPVAPVVETVEGTLPPAGGVLPGLGK